MPTFSPYTLTLDGKKARVLPAERWFRFLEVIMRPAMGPFRIGAQAPLPGVILAREEPNDETAREEMIHHAQFLELMILFAGVALLGTLGALVGGWLAWAKAWMLLTSPLIGVLMVWPVYGLIWLVGLGARTDADGDGDADGTDAYYAHLFEAEAKRHRTEKGYLARRPIFAQFRGL